MSGLVCGGSRKGVMSSSFVAKVTTFWFAASFTIGCFRTGIRWTTRNSGERHFRDPGSPRDSPRLDPEAMPTLVVDPWDWLTKDGDFVRDNPRLYRRMLRIARFIEYGGPLKTNET